MERARLESFLAEGLSLAEIGRRTGKDHSTVGYWCKRYGLTPTGRARYAPKGGLSRAELEPLVEARLSERRIAERLGVSVSTVRYWRARHGLTPTQPRGARSEAAAEARARGVGVIELECPIHGLAAFRIYDYGRTRCLCCRSEAVSRRRRRVKRILVAEAGGRCRLCGYDRCPEALEFHHVDRSSKDFALSAAGVTRSLARARQEARKCVLLCANCHAEVEAGVSIVAVGQPVAAALDTIPG